MNERIAQEVENLLSHNEVFQEMASSCRGKKQIRTIHHFACTGGTLISKCIAAQPNVFLLSEVHPYTDLHLGSGKPKYLPSDIPSLAKHADIPMQQKLAASIFKGSIAATHDHVERLGGTLVLRDHTHSDFCVGEQPEQGSSVVELLMDDFELLSLITMRDPIESFLSLKRNDWVHFQPASFDEYCRRLLKFLEVFHNVPIIWYEDFVRQPKAVMQRICQTLKLPYNNEFEDIFDIFKVTGDSGRTSDDISTRQKKEIDEALVIEAQNSRAFEKLQAKIPERELVKGYNGQI